MSNIDFSADCSSVQSLAHEVACLKATLTYILRAMGQADAGKAILNMEKFISQLEDPAQIDAFKRSIEQIKSAYRQ